MKRRSRNKLIIGLTGSFGCGKTTVAAMLRSGGARVIDADRISHAMLRSGGGAHEKVKKAFGTTDRKKLSGIVFSDKKLLKKLEGMLHPLVIKAIREGVRKAPGPLVVIDAPLLIEAGLQKMVDKVVVVKCDRKKQVARILKKGEFTRPEILRRLKSQIPQERKCAFGDFIIDNSSTLKKTKVQIDQMRRLLWRS